VKQSNNEAEISFRFLRLDKFQAYSLPHEISGSSYVKHPTNETYVASVPLTSSNFEEINDYYIRQRIALDACDIFISVKSTSAAGTIDIPAIVNRLLKYIDCKLTFSFIVS